MTTNPFLERVVLDDVSQDALATLALVFEQRTANMIALARVHPDTVMSKALIAKATARTAASNPNTPERPFNTAGGGA